MVTRTTNKYADDSVTAREPFKASNTFGEWIKEVYAVYSYGYHFPMFVWANGEWYENTDKYSRSTSKQQGQLRPHDEVRYKLTTDELKQLVSAGSVAEWVIEKARN
jgi:hypothetical protein